MRLPLAMQAGVSLLEQLKVPARAEPHDVMAALLHVQTIGRAGGMGQQHVDMPCVPVGQLLLALI